jgi:hypothetical protein
VGSKEQCWKILFKWVVADISNVSCQFWIKSEGLTHHSLHIAQVWIHDTGYASCVHWRSTVNPQVVHLFQGVPVDKLLTKSVLHCSNDLPNAFLGLCERVNLPTMKTQLSQLPMIVGSGRVNTRRALFSFTDP